MGNLSLKVLEKFFNFFFKKGYMNPEKFTSSLTFIIWFSCAQSLTNTQSMWNPRTLPFWFSHFWHFDTRNGFSGSGPGTEWIDAFKKMLSPLCSCPFLLVYYFTASLFFCSFALTKSLVPVSTSTDEEKKKSLLHLHWRFLWPYRKSTKEQKPILL